MLQSNTQSSAVNVPNAVVANANTEIMAEVREDPTYGPVAIIDGQEYPIIGDAPTLSLVQPAFVSKDAKYKKHIGDILMHITDDYEEFSEKRLLMYVGHISQGYELYPPYQGGETSLLCSSRNGIYPYVKDGVPVSEVCAEYDDNGYLRPVCPKAVWTNGVKPECTQYYIEGFLDITNPDTPIPVQLKIKSTSLGAWNKYKKAESSHRTAIQLKNKEKAKKNEPLENPKDFIIALTVDNKGQYVVPVFTLEKVDGASKFEPLCAYYRHTLFVPKQPTTKPVKAIETTNEAIESAVPTEDTAAQVEGNNNLQGSEFDIR